MSDDPRGEPTVRDREMARLQSDFLRRDGYPAMTERQIYALATTLAQARREGWLDGRRHLAQHIGRLAEQISRACAND